MRRPAGWAAARQPGRSRRPPPAASSRDRLGRAPSSRVQADRHEVGRRDPTPDDASALASSVTVELGLHGGAVRRERGQRRRRPGRRPRRGRQRAAHHAEQHRHAGPPRATRRTARARTTRPNRPVAYADPGRGRAGRESPSRRTRVRQARTVARTAARTAAATHRRPTHQPAARARPGSPPTHRAPGPNSRRSGGRSDRPLARSRRFTRSRGGHTVTRVLRSL